MANRYDIPLPGLADARGGYRGPVVCEVVGVSYRQLDYWTTTGLVTPSIRNAEGSGSQRLYGFEDIVRLKVIKRLLDAGVSLQRIRAALEFVENSDLALETVTLISDGSNVYAVDDQQEIIDLLQRGQGVFAIAVQPVYAQVEAEVAELPTEPAEPAHRSRQSARRSAAGL